MRLATESSKKRVPPKLEHILRVAENVKLVLLTATPMFNNVTEIIWLLNLMLINDKRPKINVKDIFDNGVITKSGEKKLIDASKGYISFMRGENPYSFPTRLLPSINGDKNIFAISDKPMKDIFGSPITETNTLQQLELIKSRMSSYQQKVYMKFEKLLKRTDVENAENAENDNTMVDNIVMDEEIDEDNGDGTDIQMGMQISNIVLPTLSESDDVRDYYGNVDKHNAFEKCFNRVSRKGPYNATYNTEIVAKYEQFLHPDIINKYSPKIKSILDYISNSEGIVYVYSSFLYSGIVPLAMALEHMGFNKYGGNNLLSAKKSMKPFKINNKIAQYIILSANTDFSPNNKQEIEAIKSSANKNGEIIKVVIGSSVATEGIDFKNIRQIHIMEPWYHLNKIEQIIGRGVRNCSHIDLPLEKRNTTIYKHVNMKPSSKKETIDVRVYRIADGKQRKINKVEIILKQNAVDCSLSRNILYFDPTNINKSIILETSQNKSVANFKIGDKTDSLIKCFDTKETTNKLDDSTDNVYFLQDDIDIYMDYIVSFYREKNIFTYEELKSMLSKILENFEENILKFSLDKMIRLKRKVINSQKQLGYIIYRSNKYIFQLYDKSNLRMTLDERDGKYKMKQKHIDLMKYIETMKGRQEDTIQPNDIIDEILKKIGDMSKILTGDKYKSVIYDFIIDRLTPIELLSIVKYILSADKLNDVENNIFESFKRGNVLLRDTEDTSTIYYIDISANIIYKYKNKKFDVCPQSDKRKVSRILTLLKTKIKKVIGTIKDIEGFVSGQKFKMIIPNDDGKVGSSSGSRCDQNSKLKVAVLKDKITNIDSSISFPKSSKKIVLCDIYEIMVRQNRPNKFLRPFQYNILQSKE
jgi:hypothetical protein